MQKGCKNFQMSNELELDRNSYYYNTIIDLQQMQNNNCAYDKVDVCNCCEKDRSCQGAAATRESFVREYFQKFL